MATNFGPNKRLKKKPPKPVEVPPVEKIEKPKQVNVGIGKRLVKKPKVEAAPVTPVVNKEESNILREPTDNAEIQKTTSAPVQEIKEAVEDTNGAILKPITRKKVRYEEDVEAPSKNEQSDQVYTIDQKGIEVLVDTIVSSLENKFVSKNEVERVVEKTLQRMMIDNDLN